jgi:hypothetical protein
MVQYHRRPRRDPSDRADGDFSVIDSPPVNFGVSHRRRDDREPIACYILHHPGGDVVSGSSQNLVKDDGGDHDRMTTIGTAKQFEQADASQVNQGRGINDRVRSQNAVTRQSA